ncbi:BON domain-containing protein [Dokdonella ginsengisoli]|uniref:BON domain-containing protein n=1 Tax=Dokdonella ginsengisoli TaxID=363846 RepID=A0ABV9QWC4_9GAMM
MNRSNASLVSLSLAAALLVGAASFATAQTAAPADGNEPTKSDQPVTDTWITTKVKTELATTDGVKSMEVDVKTVDGVVTLTGVLATDVAVKKAVAAAESVKGVKRVDASGLKSKE